MMPGERLVRCLTGGDIDRVPFGVGLGWSPWGETLEKWKRETKNPGLDLFCGLGFERSFVSPKVEYGMFPRFKQEILEESGDIVLVKDDCGITMRCMKDGSSMPEFLSYPVETPDDWDKLKREKFNISNGDRILENWDEFRGKIRETGEAVQVGQFPYGVFGAARDLVGVENLLTGFYDYPDMIRDMMNHLTDLWIGLWDRISEQVQIDHIHIWEDMSGKQGSLISPSMIEKFMMPCYDRIADFAKARGVRMISVDSDGDCGELVPLMMKHGVNVFFPFEVQAGNDVREYRGKYPELGIWGGLDKRALAGSITDVDAEVERAAQMISAGRYVPMFDHLIPPDAELTNFKYAAEKIRLLCGLTVSITNCNNSEIKCRKRQKSRSSQQTH